MTAPDENEDMPDYMEAAPEADDIHDDDLEPVNTRGFLGVIIAFITRLTGDFNRAFWVVNTLELFERGAYYGSMAVLAYHIHDNLGYSASETGLLFSLLMFLLYFVPLVAAALAEKVGYKKALIGAFTFMLIGYTAFGFFDEFTLLVVSILFLGFGAGTFKPMVSATIAHVTPEDKRNQGFSIYYWMINVGAFAVPLIFGLFKVLEVFDPEEAAEIVFYASTILVGINMIIVIKYFDDPITPNPDKNVFAALATMGTVMKDKSFRTLLFIYAGFWFMFSMNHAYLPLYMKHFMDAPDWFSVFFLAAINPITIVILGPYLSSKVKKYDSLKLMITGITIFSIGFLLIGFATVDALRVGDMSLIFLAGIIIFSIGEFITHPNFIAYVSKIAPEDKVAIYMGYAFIPTGLGYTIGTFTGGFMFGSIGEEMERPKLFWSMVVSIGMLTVAGLVLYDIYIAKRARRSATGSADDDGEADYLDAEEVDEKPCEEPEEFPIRMPAFIGKSKYGAHFPAVLALLIIPMLLFGSWSAGTNTYYEEEDDDDKQVLYIETDWTEDFDAYVESEEPLPEGETFEINYEFDLIGVANFSFIVKWTDDPDASGNHENQPDTFSIQVETPWEEKNDASGTNEHGQEGVAAANIDVTMSEDVEKSGTDKAQTSGVYHILIRCDNAGDQEYNGLPGLGQDEDDNGNDWEFYLEYTLWEKDTSKD